jgi:hypothetical protein
MIEFYKMPTRHFAAITVLMFSLLLPVLCKAASPVVFKDIRLGESLMIYQERSVFGVLDCNSMQASPEEHQVYLREMQQVMPGVRQVCAGVTSIAAVPAEATVLLGASRRVLRMTFQFAGEDYPQVLDAMTAKWGEGIVEVFDEHTESYWWIFDDGISISVHQAPADTDPESAEDLVLIGLAEYSLPAESPAGDL